jgi:excisionase family DNA binding protein
MPETGDAPSGEVRGGSAAVDGRGRELDARGPPEGARGRERLVPDASPGAGACHVRGEAASSADSDDEVLDVRAASKLLRVGRNTVYELVGRNQIPHRRLGKQIRFSRTAIMRWFHSWSSQGAKERQ